MFETVAYSSLFERIADVRAHRAAFIAEVSSGALTIDEVFERARRDDVVSSMKVLPAIENLPDAGKVQTRRAFEEIGIAEDAHIGAVTAEARAALPDAMARHTR